MYTEMLMRGERARRAAVAADEAAAAEEAAVRAASISSAEVTRKKYGKLIAGMFQFVFLLTF
jgi:hypothetical protein